MKITKILYKTIEKLAKWNGHLYNWYHTIALQQPLLPRYISSVDSGNFVGYLYLTKDFLENVATHHKDKNQQIASANSYSNDNKIHFPDGFRYLYDKRKRDFSPLVLM